MPPLFFFLPGRLILKGEPFTACIYLMERLLGGVVSFQLLLELVMELVPESPCGAGVDFLSWSL